MSKRQWPEWAEWADTKSPPISLRSLHAWSKVIEYRNSSSSGSTAVTISNREIAKYQQQLRDAGIYLGPIDGLWGPVTAKAVNTAIAVAAKALLPSYVPPKITQHIDPTWRAGYSKDAANRVKSFLDMIAYSEGTSTIAGSDDGYNVLVGGTLFKSYADHPRISVDLPRLGIKSTAAGRYQILARYWDVYRKELALADFSPDNQDRYVIQQIKERGAMGDILAGDYRPAINKCRNIWASFPGAGYGQREHAADKLVAKAQLSYSKLLLA